MTTADYGEGGHIRTYVDGRWLLDTKVRNVLLASGFTIWDSMDTRYNGIIQKAKHNNGQKILQ